MPVVLPYCLPDKPIVVRYSGDVAWGNLTPESFLQNPTCGGFIDINGVDWGDPFLDPQLHQQAGGAICIFRTERCRTTYVFHYGYMNMVSTFEDSMLCPRPSDTFWKPIGGAGQYVTSVWYRYPLGIRWEDHLCPTHNEIESARVQEYVLMTLYYFIPAFPSIIPLLTLFLFPCFAFLSMGGLALSNAVSTGAGRRRQRRRLDEYAE